MVQISGCSYKFVFQTHRGLGTFLNNIYSQMVLNAMNKSISDDNSPVEFFFLHTLKIEWLNSNNLNGPSDWS